MVVPTTPFGGGNRGTGTSSRTSSQPVPNRFRRVPAYVFAGTGTCGKTSSRTSSRIGGPGTGYEESESLSAALVDQLADVDHVLDVAQDVLLTTKYHFADVGDRAPRRDGHGVENGRPPVALLALADLGPRPDHAAGGGFPQPQLEVHRLPGLEVPRLVEDHLEAGAVRALAVTGSLRNLKL